MRKTSVDTIFIRHQITYTYILKIHTCSSFLLYISDLYKSSNKLNFVNIADDSTAYSKGKNINDLVTMTNQELSNVEAWLNANLLSLNVNKSTCSFISNKNILNSPAGLIRNKEITLVDKFKFLWVTVDKKLSFKDHI